jgi:hypothetical protein
MGVRYYCEKLGSTFSLVIADRNIAGFFPHQLEPS